MFVLAAEFLAEAIRTNKKIEGITIFRQEQKISQYADKTTLLLKPTESALRESLLVLTDFQSILGLKVNTDKTKVIRIGKWGDNRTKLCEDLNLDWTQKCDCLGITYDLDNFDRISDLNIEKKISEIKTIINLWNLRYLTPFGKIKIIKSLLIFKITHVLLSLPTPSNEIFDKLNMLF